MKPFDVNCLVGPWPTGGPTLANADELLAAMERLGIARALVRDTAAIHYDVSDGNTHLMALLRGQERLFPCWAAVPTATGEMGPLQEWLDALTAAQVRAICLYPKSHGYPAVDWQLDRLLDPLEARHMLVLVQTSEIGWGELHGLCGGHPGLNVVLLSTGYRVLRPVFGLMEAHENLYLDLSTLTNFGGLEDAHQHFGARRLIFGTGQPQTDGAGLVGALDYTDFRDEDRAMMLGGNLERLLGEVTP